jgi:hypothetical protein
MMLLRRFGYNTPKKGHTQMKKSIIAIALLIAIVGGKCLYQKNRINHFLEGLSVYGYSYEVESSTLCSMKIKLDITDPKKLIAVYPAFMRDNDSFTKPILKKLEKYKAPKNQSVEVDLPLFSMSAVIKMTYQYQPKTSQKKPDQFMQYLSEKKLIKSTTKCNLFTDRCRATYDDIDTVYKGKHLLIKGIAINSEFESNSSLSGSGAIAEFLIEEDNTTYSAEGLSFNLLYRNGEIFDIEEIVSAKAFSIKEKNGTKSELHGLTLGFGYFENGTSYLKLGVKKFDLPDKEDTVHMENLNMKFAIGEKGAYLFDLDKLRFEAKSDDLKIRLDGLKARYTFLDNNIYLSNGTTTLKKVEVESGAIGWFIVEDLELKSSPAVDADRLSLHERYKVARVEMKSKTEHFKLDDATFDLAIRDLGYAVIKDYYNEIIQVLKKAFIAGFKGDKKSTRKIDKDIKMLSAKYLPRVGEILKYGIKIDLNALSFSHLTMDGKDAKEMQIDGKVVLPKMTLQDIMGGRYSSKHLPIESLKAKAKIPATLLEIMKVPETEFPFKLKKEGTLRIIDIAYKKGKILFNGDAVK